MKNSNYISPGRKRELNRPAQKFPAKGWCLDNEKLDRDIRAKLDEGQISQVYLCSFLGIARATFWRIYQGNQITMETFLKLMEWLDADLNTYIKKNE